MARFVRLKAYLSGMSREPEDWVVNVEQIVSLYPGTWNPNDKETAPCVYVDTTRITGMRVDSTLDAVLGAIERVPEVVPEYMKRLKTEPSIYGPIPPATC